MAKKGKDRHPADGEAPMFGPDSIWLDEAKNPLSIASLPPEVTTPDEAVAWFMDATAGPLIGANRRDLPRASRLLRDAALMVYDANENPSRKRDFMVDDLLAFFEGESVCWEILELTGLLDERLDVRLETWLARTNPEHTAPLISRLQDFILCRAVAVAMRRFDETIRVAHAERDRALLTAHVAGLSYREIERATQGASAPGPGSRLSFGHIRRLCERYDADRADRASSGRVSAIRPGEGRPILLIDEPVRGW
jgi:hypothetical protein